MLVGSLIEVISNMQSTRGDTRARADWFPDWFPDTAEPSTTRNNATTDYLLPDRPTSGVNSYRLSDVSHGASSGGSKMETVEEAEAAEQIPSALPDDELVIERNRDRAVKYVSQIFRHLNGDTDIFLVDGLEESIFS